MLAVIIRVLEILAILWLARLLWKSLFAGSSRILGSRGAPFGGSFRFGRSASQGPTLRAGEMKKDPQCGTYVSTEISFKSRFQDEELHFCSRQCQEQFARSHPTKPL